MYSGLYCVFMLLFVLNEYSLSQKIGSGNDGNLRVCVVEGKGLYKKAGRFCPILDKSNIGIECVIGIDRLDCLRRISKGSVDFGIFTSEDLLAARWQNIDILVTDELRFHDESFEYEVVALVENESGIMHLEDLRGSRLCHPGYGYGTDWTDTMSNFLEAKIVTRKCDPNLSLTENRISGASEYFSAACKAGPWVDDKIRDRTLKSLYPSLCSLCYIPGTCSSNDKYWGRRGPLHCLTEEIGNVAWARLDDTRIHFGLLPGVTGLANPSKYSFLCNDGSTQPLVNNTSPCVWIAKPWPVVAAKRKSAAAVSVLTRQLSHQVVTSWQSALLSLIEMYHVSLSPLRPQLTIQDYLQRAVGFQSANSFAECRPPRSIVICTKTIAERHKCDWLAEAARAYGLEPPLQCILRTGNITISMRNPVQSLTPLCFDAVNKGLADVAIANSDWQVEAKRVYGLEAILYETTPIMNDLNVIIAVVKINSTIKSFKDMRGKKACFPKYDDVAWNSVIHYFNTQKLFGESKCPFENEVSDFFAAACVPGLAGDHPKLTELCGHNNEYEGQVGALKCIVDDKADVAFISMSTLKNVTDVAGYEHWTRSVKADDFRTICPEQNIQYCFISWSTIGQIYVRSNTTPMRTQELINTFKRLDRLYGINYKSQTTSFSLYAPFDHKNNVLFQDKTKFMKTLPEVLESTLPYNYETIAKENKFHECNVNSLSSRTQPDFSLVLCITNIFLYLLHSLIL